MSYRQHDPMLVLLPADRPAEFDRLPFAEQRWRGRVFLMVWTYTGSVAFSWWSALRREANDEVMAFVATVDDDEIAFRVT